MSRRYPPRGRPDPGAGAGLCASLRPGAGIGPARRGAAQRSNPPGSPPSLDTIAPRTQQCPIQESASSQSLGPIPQRAGCPVRSLAHAVGSHRTTHTLTQAAIHNLRHHVCTLKRSSHLSWSPQPSAASHQENGRPLSPYASACSTTPHSPAPLAHSACGRSCPLVSFPRPPGRAARPANRRRGSRVRCCGNRRRRRSRS